MTTRRRQRLVHREARRRRRHRRSDLRALDRRVAQLVGSGAFDAVPLACDEWVVWRQPNGPRRRLVAKDPEQEIQ